jgi:hypothetical protein
VKCLRRIIKMYEEIINEFKENLGDNLLSAVKFGTEGEPNNLLFILGTLDYSILEKIKPAVLKCSKKNKIVPLFFTKEELDDASDVFPLEFLDIKHPHDVLFGEDLIEEVKFDKKQVRRQLEYELRSKLIHLRENYVFIKKPKEIKELLKMAIPSTMPLFYGLLFLKDVSPPTELDELFKVVAEKYKIDVGVLKKIKNLDGDTSGLEDNVRDLMVFLDKLIHVVDQMKI